MFAPQPTVAPIFALSPPLLTPLERLKSPIHLADSSTATPVTCTRRRPKTTSHSQRRRRSAPRAECPPQHAFDGLPWISSLQAAPDFLNPWDLADLSLIPDSSLSDLSSCGPGPVRRRKTSLRSSPIASTSKISTSAAPGPSLPLRDTSLLSCPPAPTPKSRFVPSRVLFHNLMPVSCDYRSEQSHPCITSSRINL